MRSALILFFILMLVTVVHARAEAPDIAWSQTFGTPGSDVAYDVVETSDHNIVAIGVTSHTTSGRDGYLVRLTSSGGVLFDGHFGQTDLDDHMYTAQALAGGHVLLGGTGVGSNVYEFSNFRLAQLNEAGGVVFDNTYDLDSATDWGWGACQIADGGYIMVGSSYYYCEVHSEYDWNPTIMKVGASLVTPHFTRIDRRYTQHLHRVIPTSDGGALAVGAAGGIYLVKLTSSGDTTWVRGYGGTGSGYGVVEIPSGGYAAFGERGFNYPWDDDFWLIRLNLAGDTLWSRQYRDTADNAAYGLDICSDGGFIMCGYRYRGIGEADMYLVRTNANGDTLWTKSIGGDHTDRAYGVKQTYDGGYIVVGSTNSYGAGEDDFWIVKLNPDNPTAVEDRPNLLPAAFTLTGNYPNPFNDGTVIEYALTRRSDVTIEIFDLLGRTVRRLEAGEQGAGTHRLEWNGRDNAGQAVASGIYLYRLTAGGMSQAKKMVMLK